MRALALLLIGGCVAISSTVAQSFGVVGSSPTRMISGTSVHQAPVGATIAVQAAPPVAANPVFQQPQPYWPAVTESFVWQNSPAATFYLHQRYPDSHHNYPNYYPSQNHPNYYPYPNYYPRNPSWGTTPVAVLKK